MSWCLQLQILIGVSKSYINDANSISGNITGDAVDHILLPK